MTLPLPGFEHYLIQEEGLSPATARQYRLDCLKLATWLEGERSTLTGWPDVNARDLRTYLRLHKPAPARSRRLLSSTLAIFQLIDMKKCVWNVSKALPGDFYDVPDHRHIAKVGVAHPPI